MSSKAAEARSDGNIYLAISFALGIYFYFKGPIVITWICGGLAVAALLLRQKPKIGIYFILGYLLLGIAAGAWISQKKGFSWRRAIAPLASLYGFVHTLRQYWPAIRDRRKWDEPLNASAAEDDQQPQISIVLLRSKPKLLDEEKLTQTLTQAWDRTFSTQNEANFVVGNGGIFMVRSDIGFWTVHNHAVSYFDDHAKVVEAMPELRLRKAIEQHRAWLSVDLIRPADLTLPLDVFYPYIFRLIRELADADTLAILRPETGQINVWDEEVSASLGSLEPLEEFTHRTQPPVIRVDSDDEMMRAAEAEARSAFPEFRRRWLERDHEDAFLMKGPLQHGEHQEFIWMSITDLGDEFAYGKLENVPVNLGELCMGDAVMMQVSELNDWAIVPANGADPLGLFTVKAVNASGRRAMAQSTES